MNLSEFKEKIIFLTEKEGKKLRDDYINRFVDSESFYFKEYIEKTIKCSDGICYTGYLWDCLKTSEVITLEVFHRYKDKIGYVFVFWDIHSKDRIFIEDYWKFGKTSVLSVDFECLLNNLEYLPEDIYIFDKTLKWTFILTHEDVDNERWCLKSGEFNF
ncbi:hypothetical protein [Robertmurraya sp.]|uniref:hypothetical protein n=1 Tax=Robertmurraya sp. TaxID=2837525 RepID=UPI003703A3F1